MTFVVTESCIACRYGECAEVCSLTHSAKVAYGIFEIASSLRRLMRTSDRPDQRTRSRIDDREVHAPPSSNLQGLMYV